VYRILLGTRFGSTPSGAMLNEPGFRVSMTNLFSWHLAGHDPRGRRRGVF
jgi:hypothetical protein